MKRLLAIAAFALLMPAEAMAQQRTLYGSDGRVVGRSTTDRQGTVTTYGADGRAVSRETTTRSGTTVYDARTGNAVGKITKERR
jgi:hypothetical protein